MSSKTTTKMFLGCCSSAFLMEVLMSKVPNSANLITFLQFFFISLQGLIFTAKFGKVKPKIPLQQYALLVSLFFISSVMSNYVYALHVPSTLHMIIRSASSPASMLVSWYVKKRTPKLTNIVGSILITIGVILAMYGGATVVDKAEGKFLYYCIGVLLLTSTIITGAFTGLQQELLFSKYGKHPDEMLFYINAMPLPLFLGIYPQLRDTALGLPWDIWVTIAINIVSQFYCAFYVHELATKETSVTVTFVLTIRKFISILISAIVFKNNLTYLHVIGTVIVVVGTYVYFDFFKSRKQRPVSLKDQNKIIH